MKVKFWGREGKNLDLSKAKISNNYDILNILECGKTLPNRLEKKYSILADIFYSSFAIFF